MTLIHRTKEISQPYKRWLLMQDSSACADHLQQLIEFRPCTDSYFVNYTIKVTSIWEIHKSSNAAGYITRPTNRPLCERRKRKRHRKPTCLAGECHLLTKTHLMKGPAHARDRVAKVSHCGKGDAPLSPLRRQAGRGHRIPTNAPKLTR